MLELEGKCLKEITVIQGLKENMLIIKGNTGDITWKSETINRKKDQVKIVKLKNTIQKQRTKLLKKKETLYVLNIRVKMTREIVNLKINR